MSSTRCGAFPRPFRGWSLIVCILRNCNHVNERVLELYEPCIPVVGKFEDSEVFDAVVEYHC